MALLLLAAILTLLAARDALSLPPRGPACWMSGVVFALDASGSIDDVEYAAEVEGVARALREPELLDLVAARGGIMVAAVVWSEQANPRHVVPWQAVGNRAEAVAFGYALTSLPRAADSGYTDPGVGLDAATKLFGPGGPCVQRRLVILSSDGRESITGRHQPAITLAAARLTASRMGLSVSGLAITSDDPELAAYQRAQLVSGPAGSVLAASSADAVGTAIYALLLRGLTAQDGSSADLRAAR